MDFKNYNGKYILNGKIPVPEPDIFKWSAWFEKADRNVAKTQIKGYEVSTVFLGLDYSVALNRRPMLFETMVFLYPRPTPRDIMAGKMPRYPYEDIQERYSTWGEAEEGHRKIVAEVMGMKRA